MINMYICKHTKYKMIKSSQLMYLSFHLYFHIEIFEFFLTAILTYVLFLILAILLYNRYSNVFLTPNWSCFFLIISPLLQFSYPDYSKEHDVFTKNQKEYLIASENTLQMCACSWTYLLYICQHRKFSYFTEETSKST